MESFQGTSNKCRRDFFKILVDDIIDLEQKLQATIKERDKYRDFLETYGSHLYNCDIEYKNHCSCGLWNILGVKND